MRENGLLSSLLYVLMVLVVIYLIFRLVVGIA